MRGNWLCLLIMIGVLISSAYGKADEAPKPAPLERTDAFDNAYAASFYQFDACGDGVGGLIYRDALTEKLKQCPFTADAKKHFQLRAALQRRKSAQAMAKLVEDNGGLPIRLDGMTRSCREQMDSLEYRQVRGRLDTYAAGKASLGDVVPQPCDSAEIVP